MNRTFCYFALVLSFVVSAISVTFALLPSSGPDAAKVRLFACSVAVAAVWSGYRAWHHLRHPQEPKGWEGTKAKIEQMSSSSEVVGNFFAPRETRFRTLWSIVIIIFLALFCPPVYAWIMALLLLCLKGCTLCSEIRYFKAYHRLQELENAPVPWDDHHEDASMTVEGKDIVIIDPCYLHFGTEDLDYGTIFANNRIPPEFGLSEALSFSISDYQVSDIVDDASRRLGCWASDSNTLGCFIVEELIRLCPDNKDEISCGVVIPNFTGTVTFHFEEKKAPWTFYGDICDEDTVVLTIEGRGSVNFHSEELPQEP